MSSEWVSGLKATSADARWEALHQVLLPGEQVVVAVGVIYHPHNRIAKKLLAAQEGWRSNTNEGVLFVTDLRVLLILARGGWGGVVHPLEWVAKKVLPGKKPRLLFEYPRAQVTSSRAGLFSTLRLDCSDGAKWRFAAHGANGGRLVRDALTASVTR